jgi:hypothetical protein
MRSPNADDPGIPQDLPPMLMLICSWESLLMCGLAHRVKAVHSHSKVPNTASIAYHLLLPQIVGCNTGHDIVLGQEELRELETSFMTMLLWDFSGFGNDAVAFSATDQTVVL